MAKSGKDNCSMNLKKLEDLIEEHQHELIQHAYLLTGNMGDAEDIVQEAYIKFFRLQIELRNPKNAKSYLFKMVHFACIDLIRKNKNQQTIPINGHENLIDLENSSNKSLQTQEEEYIRLNQLLNEIPFEQAEVIRLRIYGNLSFLEIAQIFELSVSTIKSRFKYGIDKLRQKTNGKMEVYYAM